jgi:twinkle protein
LPKGFHSVGDMSKAGLFGRNKFGPGSNRSITITEGELDALSLYQVLKSPVVSVRSSGSARMDATIDRSYLNSFERIYLAFDGDEPGRSAAAEVAKLFDYNKVYDVRFTGLGRKDANDYLQAREEAELRQIWWNAKKFLPDNLMSSLGEFEKELLKPVKFGVSYPFPTLTNMTYGLRTGEVVLITAQEGVGKTEVMHSILHNLLKETDDAIGAIFIEESKQRLLQAMAGIELKCPVHLPDSGVDPVAVVSALKQVVRTDDRLYVYNHFGTDSADSILDTIRFLVTARGCRWIMFDLISLAVTGLGGDREREALEYLSARLEILTQELGFGLVMVSHVNDQGQTRGSRMISKNCHIRIDLERDVAAASDRSRLTTKVTISKNRPTSKSGPAGELYFDPQTHVLREIFSEDEFTLDEMAEAA